MDGNLDLLITSTVTFLKSYVLSTSSLRRSTGPGWGRAEKPLAEEARPSKDGHQKLLQH